MVTNVLEASFWKLPEERRPFGKREVVSFAHLSVMVNLLLVLVVVVVV